MDSRDSIKPTGPQEAAVARHPGAFASLRFPDFRFLFAAGTLIFVAIQAQQIARGQLAFDLTGTNTGLGGVYLGFGLPMLLVTPFAGVAADRFPKRILMLVSVTSLAAASAWISIVSALDGLEYWMLVASAAVHGAGTAVFSPTTVAFTGELVERRLIGNAVALTQVSFNTTRVFGPAMAGGLIAVKSIGPTGVYIITTGLLMLSAGVTFRLPSLPRSRSGVHTSIISELADGVRYSWRHPLLKILLLASFVMIIFSWPYQVFLPAIANDMYDTGGAGLGLMTSVSALAALAVTFWIASRSRPHQAWHIQAIAGGLIGFGLIGVATSPNVAVCLVALFVVGGAASGYQAMNSTIVLTVTDLEYHGRVQSLLMLSFSGFSIAALPLGAIADAIGLRTTFATMGVICMTTMAGYMLAQRHRRRRGINFDLETSPA